MSITQRSLRLRVLGPWRAWLDDRPPLRLATRHARVLLTRLALDHPRPVARAALVQDLFSGIAAESAARRLRSTRHYLRQELGDLLVVDEHGMGLDPRLQVGCDYLEFLQLTGPGASRDELAAAAALYHGRMFQSAADGWAGAAAHEAHQRYVGVLRSLVALARGVDTPAEALGPARLWVAEEPWEEQAHLACLEALIALGHRSAAQAHLSAARGLLRAGLGERPGQPLARLARAIARMAEDRPLPGAALLPPRRRGEDATAADAEATLADPYTFPLVGRDAEMAAIRGLWARALAGEPGGLLIEGASGVGASRLAGELTRQVRLRAPYIALWCAAGADHVEPARMVERGLDNLPPAGRAEVASACAAVDPLCWAALVRAMPRLQLLAPGRAAAALPALPPASEAARRVEALAALLGRIADRGALLLVFDDLPAAGAELRDLLGRLLAGRRRAAVVVTARPGACQELLAGAAPFAARAVGPLDERGAHELLETALGPAVGPALLRQLAELGGAPGFVIGALRTMIQQEVLRYDPAAGWRLATPDLPARYRPEALLTPRLERLSDGARDLAELIAVLGRPVHHGLLSALWPDEEQRLGAQAELLRNAVLVERGDELQFEHPWIQASLRQQLAEERLAALHGRVAAALAALPDAEPEERARHAAGAQRWDEALTLALASAARSLAESRLGVMEQALAIAEQAVAALDLPPLDARRWETLRLQERCAALQLPGPRWDEALARLHGLAERSGRADWQAEALHRAGLSRLLRGFPHEARATLAAAAATARANGLPELETWARLALADALDTLDCADAARHECLVAAKSAFAADVPELSLRMLIRLGQAYARAGQIDTALLLLDGLQAHPLLQQRPLLAMRHTYHLGRILIGAGQYGRGLALLRACLQQAYTVGDAYWKLRGQSELCQTLTWLGLYAESLALAEASGVLARQVGDPYSLCELHLSRAGALYGSGDRERALAAAREGAGQAARQGFVGLAAAQHCLAARAAAELGHDAEAQELLARADAELGPAAPPEQLAAAARAAMALSYPARACAYAERAVERAARPGLSAPAVALALWDAAHVIAAADEPAARAVRAAAVARLLDDLVALDAPDQRRALVTADADRRALAALAAQAAPRRLVMLPLRHAPAGRPLHADELQPVVWTLSAPDDPVSAVARRHRQIRRLADEALAQDAVVTVEALAAALDVAPRTIKRDLSALRAQDVIVTTRAVLLGTGTRPAAELAPRAHTVGEMSP